MSATPHVHPHAEPAATRTGPAPIVVGVDGTPASARALRWAARQGANGTRSLVAVHVLTYSREFNKDLSMDTARTWRRDLREKLQGAWTEPARAAGLSCRARLAEADSVASGLLEVADEEGADLIVVGAHARGRVFDRIVGTVTYQLAHRSRHPVVIVPPDWAEAAGA
jgi:nucleotide-binding universal stress UspA family protein